MTLSSTKAMKIHPTELYGVYIVDIERRSDQRGFFGRAWCQREFEESGLNPRFVQANVGFSHMKGTLRGMHYQRFPNEEVKFVRCTMGAVFDVVIDLRRDSPTFLKWVGAELTAENRRMLYAPEGCAHGYQTLADNTELYYQTSQFYAPESATGVRYNDATFGISWPLAVSVISDADRTWPGFEWRGDKTRPTPRTESQP